MNNSVRLPIRSMIMPLLRYFSWMAFEVFLYYRALFKGDHHAWNVIAYIIWFCVTFRVLGFLIVEKTKIDPDKLDMYYFYQAINRYIGTPYAVLCAVALLWFGHMVYATACLIDMLFAAIYWPALIKHNLQKVHEALGA